MDNTGTVSTEGRTDSEIYSFVGSVELLELEEIKYVVDEVMEVHGIAPGTRLFYDNENGIKSRLSRYKKLDKARDIVNELEANTVAFN